MEIFFHARFLELVAGKEATFGRLRKILSTLLLLGSLIPFAVLALGAPDTIVNGASATQGGTVTASTLDKGYPTCSLSRADHIGATQMGYRHRPPRFTNAGFHHLSILPRAQWATA